MMSVPDFVNNILLDISTISLPPELSNLGSGLIGVSLGAILQYYSNNSRTRRQTTLELYKNFESTDLLRSRIIADRLLADNLASSKPKSYSELYKDLSIDEWKNISCVRHFFDQLGLLKEINYLDNKIANSLFNNYAKYWNDTYFKKLETLEGEYASKTSQNETTWRVSSSNLEKYFL